MSEPTKTNSNESAYRVPGSQEKKPKPDGPLVSLWHKLRQKFAPQKWQKTAAERVAERRKLLNAAKGINPTPEPKPKSDFGGPYDSPEPLFPVIHVSDLAKSMVYTSFRLLGLVVYVFLLLSIFRLYVAYSQASHFIFAPADILTALRFIGINVPRIVVDYDTLQFGAPILLLVLQILAPIVTLAAIPKLKHPFWRRLEMNWRSNDSSSFQAFAIGVIGPIWNVVYFALRVVWGFAMVLLFVCPFYLLLLTAMEFLPNATIPSLQVQVLVNYFMILVFAFTLVVSVRLRKKRQGAVIIVGALIFTVPLAPIWHVTQGPKSRENLNSAALAMEVAMCKQSARLFSEINPETDCLPASNLSPLAHFFFADTEAAELGFPFAYTDSYTLNEELVLAVQEQTQLPLSYFTISRRFYRVRHDGIDLSGVDFRGSSFVIKDFSGALLGQSLFGCPLPKGTEADYNAKGCINLVSADFRGANLEGALFERVSLQGAKMDGAQMKGAKFNEVDLSFVSMRNASLENANIHWAKFLEADLEQVSLRTATLKKVDFSGASLKFLFAEKVNLTNVSLITSNLEGAFLVDAVMDNVNMAGANLLNANLTRSTIENGAFDQANFQGAQLNNAIIRNKP